MSKHVQTTSAAELDPVCGMTVNPSSAEGQVDHAGKTYYFCSSNCLKKFQQDPAKYLAKSRASAEPSLVTVGVSKPLTAGKLSPPGTTARQTDPVCGMDVDPATAKFHFEYSGKTYYFCCGGCLEKFRVDPEHYLNLKSSDNLVQLGVPRSTLAPLAQPASPSTSAAGERFYVCPMCPEVRQPAPGPCPSCGMALDPASPFPISKIEYTCPMHPEIIRSEPGSCPICGMALEPRTVTAQEENPELRNMSRRFWVSVALTTPLLLIAMADMLPGMPIQHFLPAGWLPWIEFALATPVVLWGGWPFFQRGWASLVHRSMNMFTLIAMGTGVAYVYSLIATVFPQIFPQASAE